MRAREFTTTIVDIMEESTNDMRLMLEENPVLFESLTGWDEINGVLDSIQGQNPVIGQKYSVLSLTFTPPGKALIIKGHITPLRLIEVENKPNYKVLYFSDKSDVIIKYPDDFTAGDMTYKSFLIHSTEEVEKYLTFISLKLKDWYIKNNIKTGITEVTIDNHKGAGAVPYNADIDYFGIRVKVKPSTFLRLALELNVDADAEKNIDGLASYMGGGGAIGAPFLDLTIPVEWEDGDLSKPAKITGHDGRHRMYAIMKTEGDNPVEVHLIPRGGLRARDIKPEWIERLNRDVISQRGQLIKGPWFLL